MTIEMSETRFLVLAVLRNTLHTTEGDRMHVVVVHAFLSTTCLRVSVIHVYKINLARTSGGASVPWHARGM